MAGLPVVAVFDVGKTNKKLVLFDSGYRVVHETSTSLPEIEDEDGFPCESVDALSRWVVEGYRKVGSDPGYSIRAVNFSAYGASFVLLDDVLRTAAPLYNYLKPYPPELEERFYSRYGGKETLCRETASPSLGSLNSGLQLYRLRHGDPERYRTIRHALHLPQFISFLLTGRLCSEKTSVGCHTHLWDFERGDYHRWVEEEELERLLPPFCDVNGPFHRNADGVFIGTGMHDSSSALLPYSYTFKQPFILLSTGTWSISLNPFNEDPLTPYELDNDCLCFLTPAGRQVKASRLFAGSEHMKWTRVLADHFCKDPNAYREIRYDRSVMKRLQSKSIWDHTVAKRNGGAGDLGQIDLSVFQDFEEAYHQLISILVERQVFSTGLVLGKSVVQDIFVDGGFSKNEVYMHLLAEAFPDHRLHAATVPQASALGSAINMHDSWNHDVLPEKLVETRHIPVTGINQDRT